MYRDRLSKVDGLVLPKVTEDATAVWHVFPVRLTDGRWDACIAFLGERGIGANIHCPIPIQAVTASRIGIWKKVLLEQEYASVEAELGEIFTTFGYEMKSYKVRRAKPFFINAAKKIISYIKSN